MPQGTIYKTGSNYGVPDRKTGAVRTIPVEHSLSHEGCFFCVQQKNQALANNGTILFELIVPSTSEMHLKEVVLFATGVPLLFELIETPTLTTGVTAMSPKNRHRKATWDDSTISIKSNPTSISNGTVIDEFYFGGGTGTGQTRSGGSSSVPLEWELENGLWLVRITNLSGANSSVSAQLNWYELV